MRPTTAEPILYPVILSVPADQCALKGREKVAALSEQARRALAQSCARSGLTLAVLPKDADGVPQPVNGVHWSLSHKSTVVGGVAALFSVGLDLETIRPVRSALLDKIADEKEWALVGERSETAFFRYWTAKEAVLKAVGRGMGGLAHCRVMAIHDDTRMTLTYDDAPWPVVHHRFGDHLAAIASACSRIAWTLPE